MNKIIRYLLVAMLLVTGMGLGSCSKVWEEEWVEIELCPKVDIEPGVPDWDDQDNNGAGNEED